MAAPITSKPQTAQFDVARKRAQQAENANLQTQRGALERRAAQLGGGPSGALIKQERIASNESAERVQNANEGINAQEMQERGRVQEMNDNRRFQTAERLGSQGFAGQQANMQRRFQTGERMGSQNFAAQEAKLGRKFTTSERAAAEKNAWKAMGQNQGFQAQQAQYGRDLQNAQFQQQFGFSKEQFEQQKTVDNFNMKLASAIQRANERPGGMDALFSNFGMDKLNGGGDGGSGTVICTEYFRQGWVTDKVYAATQAYGRQGFEREAKANYLAWATHVVPVMRRYPIVCWLLWPIFYNWFAYMAHQMGAGKKPLFGNLVFNVICRPLSNFVGSRIRKSRRLKVVAHAC